MAKKAKSRDNNKINKISEENEVLLHGCFAISGMGGSCFDYYIDKGIKRVAVYGQDLLVSYLVEQAYYKEIEIVYLLSDTDRILEVNFPKKRKLKLKNIRSVNLNEINVPIIAVSRNIPGTLKKLRVNGKSVEKLSDLTYYSHIKRALFDKVISYREKNRGGVKIAVINIPGFNEVANSTQREKNIKNIKKDSPQRFEQVFYVHGYNEEYALSVLENVKTVKKNGVHFIADRSGKYVNCVGGYRITADIPKSFSGTVYFFGNSVCYGVGADDLYTIPSVVQRELNKHFNNNSPFAVLNCANGGGMNCFEQWKSFEFHNPQSGDIVVFCKYFGRLLHETYKDKFIWCETKPIFDRPHDMGEVFIDHLSHLNYIGYDAIGKAFTKTLIESGALENIPSKNISNNRQENGGNFGLSTAEIAQLDEYAESLKQKYTVSDNKDITSGAIVMNCNPFTLGHRYLIEQSAKKVDRLYIFVVEEDGSIFPFKDRIRLVREGTTDLKNVTVIASGRFIISQTTFQAYFEKEENKDVVIDATYDVSIFGEKIAPALNISVRFAGEEPLDNITNQYNSTMFRILPKYGVRFEVIPRKNYNAQVISASRVRKLLKDKNFKDIAKIVPETTLKYLKQKFRD